MTNNTYLQTETHQRKKKEKTSKKKIEQNKGESKDNYKQRKIPTSLTAISIKPW